MMRRRGRCVMTAACAAVAAATSACGGPPLTADAVRALSVESDGPEIVFKLPGSATDAYDTFLETCLTPSYDHKLAIAQMQFEERRDVNPDPGWYLFAGDPDVPLVSLNTVGGTENCAVLTNFDNADRLGAMAQSFITLWFASGVDQDDQAVLRNNTVILRSWTPANARQDLRIEFIAHAAQAYAGLRTLRAPR